MQKKKITAFLLALAMVSAMALPVFAQEPNPQAETAASIAVVETATPETAATEEPKVDAEPAEDNVKEDAATYDAPPENGWYQEYPGGPWYWYENGVRQGTTGRGKEIYDPKSDAWDWLDAVQGGAMTTNKDVYQDSNGGKWVRYDANGHMIKGWNTNSQGTYYFDLITGAMAKGTVVIDGITCVFDYNTGILQSTNVDVTKYREIKRTNYYADGSVMNTLYRIADGSAEAMEFTASANTRNLGVPLKELRLRKGILIAVLARGGDIIIPEGSSSIQEGDSVILFSRDLRILDLNDIYEDEGAFPVQGGSNEH